MAHAALLEVEHHWSCPNCTATSVTHEARPHTRYHSCPGLNGMSAPFIVDGVRCKVEAVEREDYLNGDRARTDGEGRPIMSVVTTRDDGQDCAVFAPTAAPSEEQRDLVAAILRKASYGRN